MPQTATPSRGAQQARGGAVTAHPALIPFTAASHEHLEPMFDVSTAAASYASAAVQLGPFDVPAFGFLRHIWLFVQATGGTIGAGVLNADYPFNIIQSVTLADVNGAPIFGPLDGY